jgi:cation diffusion facilitator CzcD-associated flavoprotein CzcO
LPKYILGKPLDQGSFIPTFLPDKFRRRVVTTAFQILYGRMTKYGLPAPDHLIGEAHPTISTDFPQLVKEGRILVRAGFKHAENNTVTFSDGQRENFDAIIFCTGYDVAFPFFEHTHIEARDNVLPLFHRAFHLDHRSVFFVGLAQPVGAIIPIAEAQARAIAAHLAGTYNLPDRAQMAGAVERHAAEVQARFVASRRHTMQVLPEEFLKELRVDLERGRLRALAGEGIAFSASRAKEALSS